MRLIRGCRWVLTLALAGMLPGCVLFRAVDDGISGTLEKVPVLKALGVESRRSIEQRMAAKRTPDASAATAAGAATPAAIVAAGAGTGKASVQLLLCAARWVNPDARGRPAPIRVRLMELATASHFTAAPAAELMADGRPAAWASEIRDVRDVVIPPGGGIALGWLTSRDSLLGVIGDFRETADAPETRLVLAMTDQATPMRWTVYARGGTLHLLPGMADAVTSDSPRCPAALPTSRLPAGEAPVTTGTH